MSATAAEKELDLGIALGIVCAVIVIVAIIATLVGFIIIKYDTKPKTSATNPAIPPIPGAIEKPKQR